QRVAAFGTVAARRAPCLPIDFCADVLCQAGMTGNAQGEPVYAPGGESVKLPQPAFVTAHHGTDGKDQFGQHVLIHILSLRNRTLVPAPAALACRRGTATPF